MKLTIDKILALIIVLVIALALIVPERYFWNPLRSTLMWVVSPVQGVVYKSSSSVYDFFSTISKISQLSKENNTLRDEIDQLKADKANLVEVQKENEILRDQFGFQEKSPFRLLPGEIIARDPSNIQNSLTINIGSSSGITADMPVISSGMLVGKISEVHQNSSKVLLITNPNSLVNAMLQETRAYGLIKGALGYGLVMESIPQDIKVNVGDVVVTSGLGSTFPKGLLLGEVTEIISKQGEIFQSANLKPTLDFSRLELVFVIIGG